MARRRDFVGIYKPRNGIKGGAVMQIKLSGTRDCMFMELAPQVRAKDDPSPYDWKEQRIAIKLGEADIGKLLALLNGTLPLNPDTRTPDLELFHKNPKGSKIIKIKKQDHGYYIKVSMKEGGKQVSVALPVGWDEAELVRVALNKGYEIMLGW